MEHAPRLHGSQLNGSHMNPVPKTHNVARATSYRVHTSRCLIVCSARARASRAPHARTLREHAPLRTRTLLRMRSSSAQLEGLPKS